LVIEGEVGVLITVVDFCDKDVSDKGLLFLSYIEIECRLCFGVFSSGSLVS